MRTKGGHFGLGSDVDWAILERETVSRQPGERDHHLVFASWPVPFCIIALSSAKSDNQDRAQIKYHLRVQAVPLASGF